MYCVVISGVKGLAWKHRLVLYAFVRPQSNGNSWATSKLFHRAYVLGLCLLTKLCDRCRCGDAASARPICRNSMSWWRRVTMSCSTRLSTIQTTHSTSCFHHSLRHRSTPTSDTVPTIDYYQSIEDNCLTAILSRDCCIKISINYTVYYLRHCIGLLTIDNVHYSCNFICVLSDVLIKTMNEWMNEWMQSCRNDKWSKDKHFVTETVRNVSAITTGSDFTHRTRGFSRLCLCQRCEAGLEAFRWWREKPGRHPATSLALTWSLHQYNH